MGQSLLFQQWSFTWIVLFQAISNPVEKFSQYFLVNENLSVFCISLQKCVICSVYDVMWWVQMYPVLIELGFNLPVFLPNYNNVEMLA